MQQQTLDAHHGRSIVIDLCHPASPSGSTRASPSLTPGSTLSLFRVIGENVSRPAGSRADLAKCPRCRARLQRTQDMQARNAISVSALPARARPADDVLRLPPREELHPPVNVRTDHGAAT